MSFERAREVTPELIVREHSASTNTELVLLAAGSELADFTVLATLDQSAGRGRLGRSWVAPAGTALAASVLLRPRRDDAPLPTGRFGWFPIAAGVAMADTVAELVAEPVGFKWPNDVLIDGRKVCGILAELLPDGTGLVVGSGVNLTATAQQLPVPTATSLAVEGVSGDAAELADRVLAGYLDRLRDLVRDYLAAGADAQRSGLHAPRRAALHHPRPTGAGRTARGARCSSGPRPRWTQTGAFSSRRMALCGPSRRAT